MTQKDVRWQFEGMKRREVAPILGFQYIVQPSLPVSTWPLIHPLSELASQLTTLAISEAILTCRPTGVLFFCISTISLGILASMSLSAGPGATALTVVPFLPLSPSRSL